MDRGVAISMDGSGSWKDNVFMVPANGREGHWLWAGMGRDTLLFIERLRDLA